MNNQNQHQCAHFTTIALSVATFPILAGLMMMKNVGQDLLELGQESEEIFRGDRLPLLNFPHD